jgi:hypothetical protein
MGAISPNKKPVKLAKKINGQAKKHEKSSFFAFKQQIEALCCN